MAEENTEVIEELVGVTPTNKLVRPKAPDYKALGEKRAENVVAETMLSQKQAEAKAQTFKKEAQLLEEQKQNQEKQLSDVEKFLTPQRPHLEPTKENFQDFATMFSVLSALTFAVGGKGRGAGMSAMSALNGALDGYNKGRKDVFDRNMKEFEKQMQSYKNLSEETYRKLKMSLDAGGLSTEAGRALAKEVELTDQGVAAAQLRAGNTKAALQNAEMAVKQAEKLELLYEKAKDKQQKASQQQFILQRAINGLGGVASSLENISKLPSGSTTEILPNLTTRDGAINFIRNFGGRKMSSKEAQALETLLTGVSRNLASIEASGTATGLVGLATQMEKLFPKAGQSAVTTALQLSDIKRIAVENIRPAIDSGLLTADQRRTAEGLVQRIERAIPYTNDDIIQTQFGTRRTLGEAGAEKAGKGDDEARAARLRELREKASAAQ